MCSKYLDVISRESESLKPIIDYRNQPSTAIQGRLQVDDFLLCAEGGGEGKHTHPGTHGDWSGLSRADCPYMPMGLLTLSDLGLPALGLNELNDGLNVGE